MDQLNLNLLLDRENSEKKLIDCLNTFEENKKNVLTKRGMYIFGAPGSGKSVFVYKILKKLNYDIIKYDAGDVRNKTIIEKITKHNMSDKNVLSLFKKQTKTKTGMIPVDMRVGLLLSLNSTTEQNSQPTTV